MVCDIFSSIIHCSCILSSVSEVDWITFNPEKSPFSQPEALILLVILSQEYSRKLHKVYAVYY